jgi:hypothetical protein
MESWIILTAQVNPQINAGSTQTHPVSRRALHPFRLSLRLALPSTRLGLSMAGLLTD